MRKLLWFASRKLQTMRGKVSEQRGESWSKADDENSPTTKASFQKEWPFVHQSGETSTTTSTTTTATVAGPTTTTNHRSWTLWEFSTEWQSSSNSSFSLHCLKFNIKQKPISLKIAFWYAKLINLNQRTSWLWKDSTQCFYGKHGWNGRITSACRITHVTGTTGWRAIFLKNVLQYNKNPVILVVSTTMSDNATIH